MGLIWIRMTRHIGVLARSQSRTFNFPPFHCHAVKPDSFLSHPGEASDDSVPVEVIYLQEIILVWAIKCCCFQFFMCIISRNRSISHWPGQVFKPWWSESFFRTLGCWLQLVGICRLMLLAPSWSSLQCWWKLDVQTVGFNPWVLIWTALQKCMQWCNEECLRQQNCLSLFIGSSL